MFSVVLLQAMCHSQQTLGQAHFVVFCDIISIQQSSSSQPGVFAVIYCAVFDEGFDIVGNSEPQNDFPFLRTENSEGDHCLPQQIDAQ